MLAHAHVGWWLLSCGIWIAAVWPLAWRWLRVLLARERRTRAVRLVRADTVRLVRHRARCFRPPSAETPRGSDQTSRKHPGPAVVPAAGTVLLERVLGGSATLVPRRGRLCTLAIGHYPGRRLHLARARLRRAHDRRRVSSSSTRLHPVLQFFPGCSCAACASKEPLRAAYPLAIHSFRDQFPPRSRACSQITLVVQAFRVIAIWSAGKAVGVDLSPRPYYVMGPLLFLVMLVPFTINGLAVRESFVDFLLGGTGRLRAPIRRSRPGSCSSSSPS